MPPVAIEAAGLHPSLLTSQNKAAIANMCGSILGIESAHEQIAAARSDFSGMINDLARDEKGGRLRQDHYSRFLDDAMVTCRAYGIHLSHMAFPGLGKSTRGSWFLLNEMAKDRRLCTIQVAAVDKPAAARVRACRNIIESKAFSSRFPDVIPDIASNAGLGESAMGWGADAWYLRNRGQVVWPSMDSSECNTGFESRRVDIMLGDDIMTRKIALSDTLRESNVKAFKETWLEGRCALHGWILLFQNCWHEEDLAHVLIKDNRFCSIWVGIAKTLDRLFVRIWNAVPDLGIIRNPEEFDAVEVEPPADSGADYEFLMPLPDSEDFSERVLRKKFDNDETTFRQMQFLEALSDESRMFPAWSRVIRQGNHVADMLGEGFDEIGGLINATDVGRSRFSLAVGIDISGLKRPGTSIVLLGKDVAGKIYPIELHLGRYSNADILRILDSMWRRGLWFYAAMVENNGVQDQIEESIRAAAKADLNEWAYKIKGFTTGNNKADPERGLPGLNTEMENGAIVHPINESKRKDTANAKTWIALESAFTSCPRLIPTGKTSDVLMAYWLARSALHGVSIGSGRPRAKRKRNPDLRSAIDKF